MVVVQRVPSWKAITAMSSIAWDYFALRSLTFTYTSLRVILFLFFYEETSASIGSKQRIKAISNIGI